MPEPGTVLQNGMSSVISDILPTQDPIWGKIIKVNLRYSDEETQNVKTPVFVTVDVETEYGPVTYVPIMRPFPSHERLPRKGDGVILGFIKGKMEGAFVIGYLDQPNSKISRTMADEEYSEDEVGNVLKVDADGNRIEKRVASNVTIEIRK